MYGGVMALTGDRARPSTHSPAAAALWVLLVAAVALVPALRCPPALDDSHGAHLAGAAWVHAATVVPAAAAAVHSTDEHAGCQLPAAVSATMAAAGALNGWWVIAAAAAALLGALTSGWVRPCRGPPPRVHSWFLRGGRDRLHFFCVMRR
ncbi:hypothetical protein R2362_15245 [Mycobacteroides chelonae]|nr:hypothetical protein [Mycobacteroides chelonae]